MGICYDCKSIAVILNTQYLKMMIRKQPWIFVENAVIYKKFPLVMETFCPFALATI